MQTSDANKIATPADWQPGDDVIVPPPGSCGTAKERVETAKEQGIKCLDWFMCFKPLKVDVPQAASSPEAKAPAKK
jgi:peroxiredoxin (alkyl hydroperoxide reductase subunit C)